MSEGGQVGHMIPILCHPSECSNFNDPISVDFFLSLFRSELKYGLMAQLEPGEFVDLRFFSKVK